MMNGTSNIYSSSVHCVVAAAIVVAAVVVVPFVCIFRPKYKSKAYISRGACIATKEYSTLTTAAQKNETSTDERTAHTEY